MRSCHSSCIRTDPGYRPDQLETLPGSPAPQLASSCPRRTRLLCSRCPPVQTCSEAPCSRSTAARKRSGRGLPSSARGTAAQTAIQPSVLGFSSPALSALQYVLALFHAAGRHQSGAAGQDRFDVPEIRTGPAGSPGYSAQPAVAATDSADAWPAFQPAGPAVVVAAVAVAAAELDSVAVWPVSQPAAEPVAVSAVALAVAAG